MPKLTIISDIIAKPETVDLVKSELEKLVPISVKEEGCLQYDLHRDNVNPSHFMFYENWTSHDMWKKHMDAPHVAAFIKATEGAMEEFALYELTQL